MKIFSLLWKIALVVFLVSSLALNVAMFLGGTIYSIASNAFNAVTGVRTVAMQHAGEVAELGVDLADERRLSRELREEVVDVSDDLVAERTARNKLKNQMTDLSGDLTSERRVSRKLREEVVDISDDLAAERIARRKLKNQVTDLSGNLAIERLASRQVRDQASEATADLVTFRGRKVAVAEAVELTADRISKRAVKTSSRSLGSMAGEALPYIGTAVIVGVTTLELKDLCDTLIDMSELKRAFNPEMENSDDETTVCSLTVPTKEELWEYAKASPGTAWAAAKEATPTLEEIKDYEMPDVDWTGAWTATTEGAGTAWQTTKDGTGAAVDTTIETTGGWIKGATEYFAGSEDDEK